MPRPSKQDFYFSLAKDNASRATCLRRKFGAVAIRDGVSVSMGYCGAPRGEQNCSDLGYCLREKLDVPKGQRYELCRSVHAEMNTIINAAVNGQNISGADLYIYVEDGRTGKMSDAYVCEMCKRITINAKIKNVYAKTTKGIIKYKVKDWIKEEKSTRKKLIKSIIRE